MMNEEMNPEPSRIVVNAIHRRFGAEEAGEVIAKMWYSQSADCWCFQHYGMFWGVEADGYIHT